jgi:hypothetical protein
VKPLLLLATTVVLASAAAPARASSPPPAGFRTPDVAAFPPAQQARWPLVVQKCGRCHSMDVALNHAYTPAEWRASMRRMVRIPGSGISQPQSAEILDFLRWWSAGATRR